MRSASSLAVDAGGRAAEALPTYPLPAASAASSQSGGKGFSTDDESLNRFQ